MFDIGFSELLLVFVIGLIVLGPERLPVAVRTVAGWIRAMRSLASSVQQELAQELKLQELQESLNKVEQASKGSLSPELKASMQELRQTAESMQRSYREAVDPTSAGSHLDHVDEQADDAAHHADMRERASPPRHHPLSNETREKVSPPEALGSTPRASSPSEKTASPLAANTESHEK